MKKLLAALLAACLLSGFSGCVAAEEKLKVTATFYPLYIAALNVAGGVEGIEIHCMAPQEAGCPHDYQMTTADRRLLADSDVIIMNGAGLEGFLDALLPTLGVPVIDASEGIALLPGIHEGEDNPHVWVSVSGMAAQTENIARELARIDPAHAEKYARNAADYAARLTALEDEMRAALTPFKGAPIVTFHEAFDYFADEFGLRVVATVQTDHDSAPSARTLANVAAIIQRENVRALFAETQNDDASVEVLSRETGVPVYTLNPVVSGPLEHTETDAYIHIMRENMRTLVEALS